MYLCVSFSIACIARIYRRMTLVLLIYIYIYVCINGDLDFCLLRRCGVIVVRKTYVGVHGPWLSTFVLKSKEGRTSTRKKRREHWDSTHACIPFLSVYIHVLEHFFFLFFLLLHVDKYIKCKGSLTLDEQFNNNGHKFQPKNKIK